MNPQKTGIFCELVSKEGMAMSGVLIPKIGRDKQRTLTSSKYVVSYGGTSVVFIFMSFFVRVDYLVRVTVK